MEKAAGGRQGFARDRLTRRTGTWPKYRASCWFARERAETPPPQVKEGNLT